MLIAPGSKGLANTCYRDNQQQMFQHHMLQMKNHFLVDFLQDYQISRYYF